MRKVLAVCLLVVSGCACSQKECSSCSRTVSETAPNMSKEEAAKVMGEFFNTKNPTPEDLKRVEKARGVLGDTFGVFGPIVKD